MADSLSDQILYGSLVAQDAPAEILVSGKTPSSGLPGVLGTSDQVLKGEPLRLGTEALHLLADRRPDPVVLHCRSILFSKLGLPESATPPSISARIAARDRAPVSFDPKRWQWDVLLRSLASRDIELWKLGWTFNPVGELYRSLVSDEPQHRAEIVECRQCLGSELCSLSVPALDRCGYLCSHCGLRI